jgi:hypothetical protein
MHQIVRWVLYKTSRHTNSKGKKKAHVPSAHFIEYTEGIILEMSWSWCLSAQYSTKSLCSETVLYSLGWCQSCILARSRRILKRKVKKVRSGSESEREKGREKCSKSNFRMQAHQGPRPDRDRPNRVSGCAHGGGGELVGAHGHRRGVHALTRAPDVTRLPVLERRRCSCWHGGGATNALLL